jgi:hypothetical protein
LYRYSAVAALLSILDGASADAISMHRVVVVVGAVQVRESS